jgi:cell division protein FtsL
MDKAALRRALHVLAVIIIIVLAVGLYRAKSDASKTEAHVRALQTEIAEREAGLRALRAEIAEQESPENIERLAEQHGAVVGSESSALPESQIDDRLPAARRPAAHP